MLRLLLFLIFLEYALAMCATENSVGKPEPVFIYSKSIFKIADFASQQYSRQIGADFALSSIINGTIHIVDGNLYVLNVIVNENNCLDEQVCEYRQCKFRVFEQEWMPVTKTLLDYTCVNILTLE